MSVGNIEKPSLLASLLAQETQNSSTNSRGSGQADTLFSDKLDKILTQDANNSQMDAARAKTLAESLKLQMLQATLSMSGEQSAGTAVNPLFGRQSSSFKALIEAYSSNQAETSTESSQPLKPSQPLPDADISTQATTTVSSTVRWEKGSQWVDPIIAKASKRYGVDAALIKAVIKAESSFNPNAVSHAGAQGLMQLMPGTARSLGVSDSFDPEQNVMGGTRFLRDLLNRYNGDIDSALAAYNWGPGNVDKRPDRLPRETRDYLVRVKQLYLSYTA